MKRLLPVLLLLISLSSVSYATSSRGPDIGPSGGGSSGSISDTNAGTVCSGDTTYLSGESNCNDLSSVYQPLDADLTTYAGITPTANAQTLLGQTFAQMQGSLSVDDLITLSGVSGGAVDLGTFTGSTIDDNLTIKGAFQDLETFVEGLGGGHDALTLDANADTLLSLSTQELGLDTQTANTVFAGPTTGAAAVPTFRSLVDDDIPDDITIDTATSAGSLTGDLDPDQLSGDTVDNNLVDVGIIDWANLSSAQIQSAGINWTDVNNLEIQTSGINWSSVVNSEIQTSGINWDSVINAELQTSGINWDSIINSEIQRAGMNWSSLSQDIQTSGVNWDSVVNSELQSAGFNWSSVSGEINQAAINWDNISSVANPGEVAVDLTDDQLQYYGAAKRVLPYTYEKCFTTLAPDGADDDIPLWSPVDAITITGVYCRTQGGTSVGITLSDGTNALEQVVCDSDGQADDGSIANGTFTANERVEYDTGTVTGSVDAVNVCVRYTVDAQ